jgi:D-alanyl-D-alanine carboxypeptidase/D-alanyl-D-alanine-endopeptidase (penicillin-binding protein 4)
VPTKAGLAGRLGPLLYDGALGSLTTGAVVDAVSGRTVWGQRPGTPAVPASTTKVATAVSATANPAAAEPATTCQFFGTGTPDQPLSRPHTSVGDT